MSAEASVLRPDRVHEVLAGRQVPDLRFRSAMITSTALHTAAMLALLLAPLLIPKPVIFDFSPVNLVALEPPPPEPAPTPPAEEDQALEPEPPPEPDEPEDVPEDLEAQRRQEAEEEARLRAEEEARRRAAEERRARDEAERRRREEEERRRREEEERRRQPQQATRSDRSQQQPEITQEAQRGASVGFMGSEEASVTEEDFAFRYWLDRVLVNIANKWDPPPRAMGSREILSVVHFRVSRSGEIIVGPEVRTGSSSRAYDRAALRAITAGQPFPPLPQAYRGRSLGINLGFRQQ